MKTYLDIVQHILDNGQRKSNRTGVDTLVVPNVHFSHDIKDGFPLLTTKKMAFKTMLVELEGFIKGITSKRWYQERGCKIWNEWANPQKVQDKLCELPPEQQTDDARKEIQLVENDLGPIYGYQWRQFGKAYNPFDDGNKSGFDQLKYIVETLKTNPDDRRMVCSAWNPRQFYLMALPPCHLDFVVSHINGTLNLHWTQRSCDFALGASINISSYATLLLLLCKTTNMTPGNLSAIFCDCHIYENHIEGLREQLTRTPAKLPSLSITKDDIFEWTHEDVELNDYNPQDAIKFPIAV